MQTATNGLDSAILQVYGVFNRPADQIVSDPALNEEFCRKVNASLGVKPPVEIAAVNKRLLNLRRRGEENGGLPRQFRGYNGRQVNRPR